VAKVTRLLRSGGKSDKSDQKEVTTGPLRGSDKSGKKEVAKVAGRKTITDQQMWRQQNDDQKL
jgi:hypothetical protein